MLWTVWRLAGGQSTLVREGRWHEYGAEDLWKCHLDEGVDESGLPTGIRHRLVIDPPVEVQTAVAIGVRADAAARLRSLVGSPLGSAILGALGRVHVSKGVLSAFAAHPTGLRTGAFVLDALAPVILEADPERLVAVLQRASAALKSVEHIRPSPDATVSVLHLQGVPIPLDVEPLEADDLPTWAQRRQRERPDLRDA